MLLCCYVEMLKCFVLLCCYVSGYVVMLCCYVMWLCYVVVVSSYVVSGYVVMLCYVMLCCVVLCCVVFVELVVRHLECVLLGQLSNMTIIAAMVWAAWA
jgi:hypothetical protein